MINISFHQKNDEHILNNFINKMANWQSIQSLRIKMKFAPSGVYQSFDYQDIPYQSFICSKFELGRYGRK